ncbi:uncharacterized protein PRCAT00005879001 [Priceomyces carsonii]|uniref:uncharacterized protein n=1 Tax=Priceomyces carsonii TaxID=28549 RepID=UPI002ED9E6B1|nr:unnamed protein product [Priceomyces carsonii]
MSATTLATAAACLGISSKSPEDLPYERFKTLKQKCIKPQNYDAVRASWKRLLISMSKELDKISGEDYIPQVNFEDIIANNLQIPPKTVEDLKKKGCLIIRDLIPDKEAIGWKNRILDYFEKHGDITGSPESGPSNWYVHWSQSQVEARAHPRMVQLMKAVGDVYSNVNSDDPIDMMSQVVYADRVRVRSPGKQVTLNLHADSSSIERWEDDGYRDVYREIFEGNWEQWDPYVINKRLLSIQDLYEGVSANGSTCSVFRSFQGWLALSDAKSGEGTIRFLPDLKHVIPYILLRPFFWNDITDEIDVTSTKFPGATPGSGQFMAYDEGLFPHLKHNKSVVGIADVKPGDFVLWHADLLHEVDKEHNGAEDSSVMFIAHTPLCEYNIQTLLNSRDAFLNGLKPKDFVYELKYGPDESLYEDRGKQENILSDEGLMALGLKKFNVDEENITSGQKKIRKLANSILFPEKEQKRN